MGNLLASLLSSAGAMRAFDRQLQITQNNVANSSTPGYARQESPLEALPFQPDGGLSGGVRAGEMHSARDEFSEQAVRRRTIALGNSDQKATSLTALQSLFDVAGNSGIPQALNALFRSFSAWGQSPASGVAQSDVLARAADVASAFHNTAAEASAQMRSSEQQISQTVQQINSVTRQLQSINQAIRAGGRNDGGLDARLNSTLEELGNLVDFSSLKQADGTVTVVMNGSVPLVSGDQQYDVGFAMQQPANPSPTYADAPATARILASDGSDITAGTTGGRLGALVEVRNGVLAGLMGDGAQQGDLNRLAQGFADRVNQLLTSGHTTDGPPAQSGVPLFTYDAGTGSAASLAVAPDIKGSDLAAIDPGPPSVANGIALKLSALATPTNDADRIDGASYNEFFGALAGQIGTQINAATAGRDAGQSLLAQAKQLRQQNSGVSLDEEATRLIEFQRAYQANAQLIKVLDSLTEEAIKLLG